MSVNVFQELVIQQLEDEIERLYKHHKGEGIMTDQLTISQPITGGSNAAVTQLQNKLKQAAKHIRQLAKEKQQLIEVGNRLRAELNKNGKWVTGCRIKQAW